jgi:hypothetical protein
LPRRRLAGVRGLGTRRRRGVGVLLTRDGAGRVRLDFIVRFTVRLAVMVTRWGEAGKC